MTGSICIIGAGAAGLSLARTLAGRGKRVILIEGGDVEPPDELEDTYRVEMAGTPHRGVSVGRFRAWGGSTTRWGGQLWPWEPHEFEPRLHLALNGWPISYEEVARHYPAAFSLLGIPGGTLTPDEAGRRGVEIPPLSAEAFTLKYSASLPWRLRNLGRSVGAALKRDSRVETHLRTTVRSVVMDAAGRRAIGVRVRLPTGREQEIVSDSVVVAAGAIESARLLFASQPLGNRARWLGRGFMDHLSVRIGRFRPRDFRSFSRMFAPVFVKGVQHTPRILLHRDVLRHEALLSAYGHWDITLPVDSGLLFIRDKLRTIQKGRGVQWSPGDMRRTAAAAGDALRLARGIVIDGRRPIPPHSEINLRVDSEQRPDFESRILRTAGMDSMGLPRVALDWRISDLERRTVVRTAELLAAEFERRGIGTLDPWSDPFTPPVEWGELKGDSFHMMGGTRMAAHETDGVVDTNCRVFGTENVYVAGASTFPTGGMANPTLTLIALALRLADHLAPPAK